MRFHLEMKIQENLKSGMSHKEAGNAAQREFGNQIRLRERSREMWGFVGWRSCCRIFTTGCGC